MAESFIENVNKIAEKLDIIVEANTIFDDGVVPILEEIAALDLGEAVADLQKGTFLGNRKLDIDLALNKEGIDSSNTITDNIAVWNDTSSTVYYDKATVTFVDGVVIEFAFVNDDAQSIMISNNGSLVSQLLTNDTFTAKMVNSGLFDDVGGATGNLVRFYDITGSSSNIERIQLNAVSGSYKVQNPIYFWGLTTSSFQTLAMRASDIIKLGNDIENIIVLAHRIDEMLELQAQLPALVTNVDSLYANIAKLVVLHTNIAAITNIHTNMAKITALDANMDNITAIVNDVIPNIAAIVSAHDAALVATTKATEAAASASAANTSKIAAEAAATTATTKSNEIKSVSVSTTTTGAAGTMASVVYNPTTGKFSFVVPQGIKGDKGDAFAVNSVGMLAQRSLYDAQVIGFSFLAVDESKIYFKLSATSGDWSSGAPFGKGETGDTGATGNGIMDTQFSSTTHSSGLAAQSGGVDTYTITYTDTTTDTFVVRNGLDSDVHMADLSAHTSSTTNPHGVTKLQVGLGNVDNTSDADKNVLSATKLTTARTINGVPFDGTEDIVISSSVPIDEIISHLSITASTYTDGNLTSMAYTGGYKTLYTYSSGNLSTVQYTDTDGTTVLLTETFAYDVNGNLSTVTRS